jgi:hypothetical protein
MTGWASNATVPNCAVVGSALTLSRCPATPVSREDASFEAFFNSAWDRLFR